MILGEESQAMLPKIEQLTREFHENLENHRNLIEFRLERIEKTCDRLNEELRSRVQRMWWMDLRIGKAIYTLNQSLDEIVKKKETKRIMSEYYHYPPILLRRIELFGLSALTKSEHDVIFRIKVEKYIKCLIEEKWPNSSDVDFENMTFILYSNPEKFYFSKIEWFGLYSERFSDCPHLENIMNFQDLIFRITHVTTDKCYPRGVFVMPEIEIEVINH